MSLIQLKKFMMDIHKKLKLNAWTIILSYFIVTLFFTYNIWLSDGVISFTHDWSFSFSAQSTSYSDKEVWYSYYDKYLGSGPTYSTSYIYLILLSGLGKIGFSGAFLSKFILSSCIFSAGLFSYYFLRRVFNFAKTICFGAGFLYLSTPFVFYRAVAGHIYFLIGYALMPLLLYFLMMAYQSKNKVRLIEYSLIASALIFVIGWQIQFFALVVPIAIAFWFFSKNTWKFKLLSSLIIIFLNIIYSLPWLMVLLLKRDVSDGFRGALSFKFIEYQSKFTTIQNIIQGREGFAPYFGNTINALHPIFQYLFYFSISTTIVIVCYGVYSTYIFDKKNKNTKLDFRSFALLLTIILFITFFFTKGVNAPFGEINLLLYKYVPILGLFREIYNFAYLIVFAYLIFFCFSIDRIDKFFKKEYNFKFSVSAILMISSLVGYIPIYASGNFGNLINSYDLSYQSEISKLIENQRVLFLPNLQPYNTDKNSKWGGYDIFQARNNFSTFSQGDAKDSFQQNYFYYVNYCLIFDDNCSDKLPNILSNLSFSKIVLYKDLYSIYQSVTGLGLDKEESLKFKNINYQDKLQKMGLKKIYETDKFAIYDINSPKPLIYAGTNNSTILGGLDISNINNLESFSNANIFPSQRKNLAKNVNNIDNVVIKNNKLSLLDLESDIDTELIEPGFFVDGENWFSYYNYWWRKNYSNSGYNGVFTNAPDNKLEMLIQLKKTQNYQVWVSIGQQDSIKNSKFELSIKNTNFKKIVENNDNLRASGLVDLGETKIDSGQNVLELRNIYGETMVDAIFLKPIKNTNLVDFSEKNIFLLNDATSLNYQKTTSDIIPSNLDDYSTTVFNPDQTGTEFEKVREGGYNKFTIDFNKKLNNVAEFINIRSSLHDIPISQFRKLSNYSLNYKTPTPDDVLLDINISYKIKGVDKTVFYKRFDNLNSSGLISVDLTPLPALIYNTLQINEDVEDGDIQISSLNILLNKKINSQTKDKTQIFYIDDPVFESTKDTFIGKEGYSLLMSHINPKIYYELLSEYISTVTDTVNIKSVSINNFNQVFFPYKNQDLRTDAGINASNIILYPKESKSTSEFAVLNVDINKELSKENDMIYIPIDMDNEKSFVDVLLTSDDNKSEVFRSINTESGKSYVLIDLKKINQPKNGFSRLQFVFNKKIGVTQNDPIEFNIGNLLLINGYEEFYRNSLQKSNKQTFIKLNVPKSGSYSFETVFSDGAKIKSDIELNSGLNDVEIPNQSDYKVLNYTLLRPLVENYRVNNKSKNINFTKISSTEYRFDLTDDFITSDRIFVNLNVTYDPDWELFYNDKLISNSFRGNFIFNAFNIDKPKSGKYTIKYRLQIYRIATLGIVFSLFITQLLWFGYRIIVRFR